MRRTVAVVVAVALLASGCNGASKSSATKTGATTSGATTSSATTSSATETPAQSSAAVAPVAQGSAVPPTPQATVTTLASAGIATVADESTTTALAPVSGATVFTVTAWQAQNMAYEAQGHGGTTGADLDTILPMPPHSPQIDDIIGAWSMAKADPAEVAADRLLAGQSWTDPERVVFPTEVLTLFVADVLLHVGPQGAAAPTTSGAAYRGSGMVVENASLAEAPCTSVTDFVNDTLDKVFGLLKLNPNDVEAYVTGKLGSGALATLVGSVAGWLASLWNEALTLAEQTVKDLIKQLSQPFLNALALVIGGVAVITMIKNYLKPWEAAVKPTPAANDFPVSTTSGNPGSFTVTIDNAAASEDWPPILKDCARAADVALPTLSAPGAPVTWKVSPQEPGLVAPGALTGPLTTDLNETLDYTTGFEDAHVHNAGTLVSPTVTVDVRVRRTEVEDLRKFITTYLEGKIPTPLKPFLSPILEYYIDYMVSWLDPLTAVNGHSTIVVSHHVPKVVPGCVSTPGGGIPAGTYAGTFNATIVTAFRLTAGGKTIPNAGGGSTTMTGAVRIVSNGRTVSGTMTMTGTGTSHVGLPGEVNVHSTDSGGLSSTISGPATSPVVTGTLSGQWASLDAPIANAAGSGSNAVHAGLDVTGADCASVEGNAVAMFAQFAAPVAQYITISGTGAWTATRTS